MTLGKIRPIGPAKEFCPIHQTGKSVIWNGVKILVGLLLLYQIVSYLYEFYVLFNNHVSSLSSFKKIMGLKVAVCLSGQLRTYKDTFTSFRKNIQEVTNCDVFMCLGDDESNLDIEKSLLLYEPKAYCISSYRYDSSENEIYQACNRKALAYMTQKMLECDTLRQNYEREHNFKYDVVIRCRYDLHFYETLPHDFASVVRKNPLAVVCPTLDRTFFWGLPQNVTNVYPFGAIVSDQIFLTSSDAMTSIIKKFYARVRKYIPPAKIIGGIVVTEKLLDEIISQHWDGHLKHYKFCIHREGIPASVLKGVHGVYLQLKKIFD